MRSAIIIVAISFVIAARAGAGAFVPLRIARSPGYHDYHHGHGRYNNGYGGVDQGPVATASAGSQPGSFQAGRPSGWPGYNSLGMRPFGNGPAVRGGAFGGSDSTANAQSQTFNGNGFSASSSSASASSHSSGYGTPTSAVAQALTAGRK